VGLIFWNAERRIAYSMYKSLGVRVGVSMPAEPVRSDDVVIKMRVVCVGKTGGRRFEGFEAK